MMILIKIILFAVVFEIAHGSGVHELQPVAPVGGAPVVTAASSQYFQRTFNRLVAAPVFEQVPVAPVLPVQPAPIIPVAPQPPVVVEATRTTVLPAAPTTAPRLPQNTPADPNVAIAIATAQAAAPVATILLPPYPFGFPPGFNFIPQPAANFPTDNPNRESTTQIPTTKTIKTTTQRTQETTTSRPSNLDSNLFQGLPSNENVNVFRQYAAPQQNPQTSALKPQKLKTTFEVVPVPLTYIAPPPLELHHHHSHHHHHHSLPLKAIPHIHTFIPKPTKIIIRPVSAPLRVRTVRVPAGLVAYRVSQRSRNIPRRVAQNSRSNNRDTEPTTFRPINRPFTKPPRI